MIPALETEALIAVIMDDRETLHKLLDDLYVSELRKLSADAEDLRRSAARVAWRKERRASTQGSTSTLPGGTSS